MAAPSSPARPLFLYSLACAAIWIAFCLPSTLPLSEQALLKDVLRFALPGSVQIETLIEPLG